MANLSYIKNEQFTDLVKFENQVWYGLQKILGKDFCKTGYFKPYWNEVKKGKFLHRVGNVLIDVDASVGIKIEQQDDVPQEEIGTKVDVPVSTQLFGKVTEAGKGTECDVRFYHKGRQVGFLNTTKLHDETTDVGKEIAKQLGVGTLELTVTKNWESEVEVGEQNDYL